MPMKSSLRFALTMPVTGLLPYNRLSTSRASPLLHATSVAASEVSYAPAQVAHAPSLQGLERLPFYCQYPLDRKAEWRRDTEALSQLFSDDRAKLVVVWRDKCLVSTTPPHETTDQQQQQQGLSLASGQVNSSTTNDNLVQGAAAQHARWPVLAQPAAAAAAAHATPDSPHIFLGLDAQGAPYFAVQVNDPAAVRSAAGPGAEWLSARNAGPDLGPGEAALLAVATSLMQWHQTSLYHGSSGSPTVPSSGGFSRKTTDGKQSLYPRIDPAVIMLVTAGDWCLLGRKSEWPAGRYSTLAGFLEVGEPLEVAVAREVEEESGVPVELDSVTYLTSQPWPFPRSLMVGFYAQPRGFAAAASTARKGFDLLEGPGRKAALDVGLSQDEVSQALLPHLPPTTADVEELADVRWIHRDVLDASLAGSVSPGLDQFHIPGHYSLAYRLITRWLAGEAGPDASRVSAHKPWAGDAIRQVSIDQGVFKYVLMRLSDRNGSSKLLVWGDSRAPYHMDVLQKAKAQAAQLGLSITELGGGRIEHHPEQKVVSIYGFSAAFGPAPHEITAALIRKWYPFYDPKLVTASYEGY